MSHVPCIQEGIPALTSFVNSTGNPNDYRIVAIQFNSLDEAGDWNRVHNETQHLERM